MLVFPKFECKISAFLVHYSLNTSQFIVKILS